MVLRKIRREGFDWCSVAGYCECGDELTGSLFCGDNLLARQVNYKLLTL